MRGSLALNRGHRTGQARRGPSHSPLECPNGSQTGLSRLKPKACSYDPDGLCVGLPDGLVPSEAQGV